MSDLVIAVTGGRNYGMCKRGEPVLRRREAESERATLITTLNALHPRLVLHGGATGADTCAQHWCQLNNVPYIEYVPNLGKYGSPAAYHIRNREMIDDLKRYKSAKVEVALVRFPGGTGTAATADYALSKRVRIVLPSDVTIGELAEARADVVVGQSSMPL